MISTERDIGELGLVPNLPGVIRVFQDDLGFVVKAQGISVDGDTLFLALVSLYEALEAKEQKLAPRKDANYYVVYSIRRQIENNLNLRKGSDSLQDLFDSF
jgi:hypothetical protein